MGGGSQGPVGPDLAAGIPLGDLVEGTPLLGHYGDESVLVVRDGDEVFAIGAHCSHYGGPLAEGLVVGDTVRCPWHHACFSLRTGEPLRTPALLPVACYTILKDGDSIRVAGKHTDPGTVRPRAQRDASPHAVAIVGAGAAGNSCAEELRRLGYGGAVVLMDPDDAAPYDRPNLSKDYLAGNAPEEWIPLHPRSYYHEIGIELLAGRKVARLDAGQKRLTFDDGSSRDFGAVVLAPGSVPVALEIPGDGPPVFTLRSLRDSRAIIAAASGKSRVVVSGASFIGLEVAAALRTRGLEVHVVAPGERPLERILGREFGDFVRGVHESHGVVFHFRTKVAKREPGHVILQNGTRLAADFLVAGVGVRPLTDLAAGAGLRVDEGILVDAFLETSSPGIFAAGDVARYPEPRLGKLVRIEHWVHAERQGQAVARNLAGLRAPFTDVPFFWSQHYDIAIHYVGHAETWDAIEIEGSLEKHDCTVRYRHSGSVVAVATVFRDRDSLLAELEMERAAGA